MTVQQGQRLAAWRLQKGMTQDQAAAAGGVEKRTYWSYEKGKREPRPDFLMRLAEQGLNSNWVLTGGGPIDLKPENILPQMDMHVALDARAPRAKRRAAEARREERLRGVQSKLKSGACGVDLASNKSGEYSSIPLLDVRASAGGGSVVDDAQVVDVLHFKREWLHHELRANPSDLRLIFVAGDSMEPTLRAGDILLLNLEDQTVRRDGIYVVRLDDTLIVKRLQKLPGGKLKVASDNAAYEPFTLSWPLDEKSDVAILGRVVWMGRRT